MIDFIHDFLNYWQTVAPGKLFRIFWYYFIFDFCRYVVWEFFILIIESFRKQDIRAKQAEAQQQLYQEYPLVSVIAPGKNEGRHIPHLARSLRNQTYKNLEIIIIDDGSDDNTREVCQQAFREGLIDTFFRNDVRGGKASAANMALRFSHGKFIVHLDADSHLKPDAITKLLVPFYMDKKIGAVGGDIRVSNLDASMIATLQGIEYMKTISIGRRVNSFLGIIRIISGAFGAFRRDALIRVGGWDIGPGLDGDITLKFRKSGYKVAFEPESVCFTNVPTTVRKLAKQRYRWDKSLIRFRIRKHLDILLPTANFNFSNFLAVMDNIFFNFILNFKWFIYIIDIIVNFPHVLKYIVLMNYLLYFISNIAQFIIALKLTPDREIAKRYRKLIVYLPLMPLYHGIFIRCIRTYSYLAELLFKKSYEDPWNPWKVSRIAKKSGM
jgi:cellulose synthase/poly-beta-1,6-N-acetylglucosamine synthase-like glycosyltransferase